MEPIPSPPRTPLVGHIPLIMGDKLIQACMDIAAEHGPLVRLSLLNEIVMVSSAEILGEVLAAKHDKMLGAPLEELRDLVGDALFTAHTHEKNWATAHEVLVPAFRRNAMKAYFDGMLEIAENMLSAWDELPAGSKVDVPEQMTRLTFDTIGLTGFGYRFDSFERTDQHPFVDSMMGALMEAMSRVQVPKPLHRFRWKANRTFAANKEVMDRTVDDLIKKRRAEGVGDGRDLLDRMLAGVTKSGDQLDDVSIRQQILTFLIAGHETTSGALSFAIHYLLEDPALMARVVEEVDEVLGDTRKPSWEQVAKLKLVGRVIKEGLRVWPTAPAFAVTLDEDLVVANRWTIPANMEVLALLPAIHRDPAVWDEPEKFDPDRFLKEAEKKRPRGAYKPFGDGKRACIGSQFAMLESTLVLGMVLQRYTLIPNPDYTLDVVETLTLKPGGLVVEIRPRS